MSAPVKGRLVEDEGLAAVPATAGAWALALTEDGVYDEDWTAGGFTQPDSVIEPADTHAAAAAALGIINSDISATEPAISRLLHMPIPCPIEDSSRTEPCAGSPTQILRLTLTES